MISSFVLDVFRSRILSLHHTDSRPRPPGLITSSDATYHCGAVHILNEGVAGVDRGAAWSVEGEKQGAQYAALRGTGAECEGCGGAGANPDPLWTLWQKVLNAEACGMRQSEVQQFPHKTVGKDGVKCWTIINKEKTGVISVCALHGKMAAIFAQSVISHQWQYRFKKKK